MPWWRCAAMLLGLWAAAGPLRAEPALKLATTTSTQNSGILDFLLPRFEQAQGVKVSVIAAGTGKALKLGEQGDVDVVMVHAPELEQEYVAQGVFVNREPIMFNDFVLLGPPSDPAHVRDAPSAAEAMRRIAGAQALFISRGDQSGTHVKEKALWAAAGLSPSGRWYQEVGQGMGATLRIAHERQGYTLSDDGTYYAYRTQLDLVILSRREPLLVNPYAVMAVNPARHPHVDYAHALALVRWLASPEGQALIGSYEQNGRALFTPGIPPQLRTAR